MKKLNISKKFFIWILCCLFCCVVSLALFLWRENLARSLDSQQMAKRWNSRGGVSQISCFFSENSEMTEETLFSFEYALNNALQEASVTVESENESARLWVDAYSAPGTINVSSERTAMTVKSLGVGGDFFLFHPQKLLYGSYFSGKDLNQDYIIIDEEMAWQLFGASDIVGKIVYVGGAPHVISAVISRPESRMEKAAGLDESVAYVSYSSISEYGTTGGINHYEIVMPNLIRGFAMQQVKENLKVDENKCEFIENTGRYSVAASFQVIGQFGFRSMNGKAILFPYWENLARGYEDIIALITLFMVLFITFPALTVIVWLIYRWRYRSWTVKSVWEKAEKGLRILRERLRRKKMEELRKTEE